MLLLMFRAVWVNFKTSFALLFLPAANEVYESYVFTGVCLSTGEEACVPPRHAHPPWHTQPPPGMHTPKAHTTLQACTHIGHACPQRACTPPADTKRCAQ